MVETRKRRQPPPGQESDERNGKETHDGADDAEPWDIFTSRSQLTARTGQGFVMST